MCAGARDDTPARITSQLDFEATYFKLVHTSGTICGKKWGCSGDSQTMIITNTARETLSRAPGDRLHRTDMESPEMVIQASRPVMIKTNDQLDVWFITDFLDGVTTYSANERACFNVYAYGRDFGCSHGHFVSPIRKKEILVRI